MKTESYIGNELDLFSSAKNWKNYLCHLLKLNINGDVLEVGAGIGSMTKALVNSNYNSWTCIEPDADLIKEILLITESDERYSNHKVINTNLRNIEGTASFKTILYIDVLEHIKEDAEELAAASQLLSEGGRLIVMSPSHQLLYSEFDKAIGHYRRYSKKSLNQISPSELELVTLKYLDSIGFFASLANRLFLHNSVPTKKQIIFWDNLMVPVSRVMDVLLLYNFGKSILGVWEKKYCT